MTRALSWLRGEVPAPKRLRLAEAVSLGEKRFVAIIHAEGHKYLVGGGSSGVVLLTELNEPAKPRNLESFAELIEAAG
ncbi:MAG: flagellar biosynthetic protein FliO [Terracidiphilus sp.]